MWLVPSAPNQMHDCIPDGAHPTYTEEHIVTVPRDRERGCLYFVGRVAGIGLSTQLSFDTAR